MIATDEQFLSGLVEDGLATAETAALVASIVDAVGGSPTIAAGPDGRVGVTWLGSDGEVRADVTVTEDAIECFAWIDDWESPRAPLSDAEVAFLQTATVESGR